MVLGALLMERRRRRERERERERGRGIDPNHFFPHIFFCVSLSLSLSLEFRVTNTLDPQKKKEKNILCLSSQQRKNTFNTNTPLLRRFCFLCCPNDFGKRERERETQQRRRRDFGLCANPKLRCCGEKDTCDDGTRLLENSLSMKTRDDICVV